MTSPSRSPSVIRRKTNKTSPTNARRFIGTVIISVLIVFTIIYYLHRSSHSPQPQRNDNAVNLSNFDGDGGPTEVVWRQIDIPDPVEPPFDTKYQFSRATHQERLEQLAGVGQKVKWEPSDDPSYRPLNAMFGERPVEPDCKVRPLMDKEFSSAINSQSKTVVGVKADDTSIRWDSDGGIAYRNFGLDHQGEMDKVEGLVLVPTDNHLISKIYRMRIRESWGLRLRDPRGKMKSALIFFVGSVNIDALDVAEMKQEAEHFGDLVILPLASEGIRKQGLKAALMYEWVYARRQSLFKSLRWIFRAEADSWVNVDLFKALDSEHDPQRIMLGYRLDWVKVEERGQWRNARYWSWTYPPFMVGIGYVMSADVLDWIGRNIQEGWMGIYPSEDSMIGVWVSGIDIKLVHDPRFHMIATAGDSKVLEPPDCGKDAIVIHNLSPRGIKRVDMRYKIYDRWKQEYTKKLEAFKASWI